MTFDPLDTKWYNINIPSHDLYEWAKTLEGKEAIVTDDCFCESEVREVLFFSMSAVTKTLRKGDVVKIIKLWHPKMYQPLVRVMKDNVYYDIYPKYLKEIV